MYRYALLALLSATVAPSALSAATFTPATSADLQTALTTAAGSAEDDTIELQATTYFTNDNSNATFVYNATDGGALTITGAGIGSSILDGNSARQVLQILSTGAGDGVQISGLTIQNGQNSNITGLSIETSDGAQTMTDCEIKTNTLAASIGGASLIASGSANLTVNNSSIQDNSGEGTPGIQLVTLGNVQFNDNVVVNNQDPGAGGSAGGATLTSNGTGTSVEARGNEFRENTGGFVNGIQLAAGNGATLILEGNTIADNQRDASFAGGAQLQSNADSLLTVRDNVISGNTGSFATGIQVQQNGLADMIFEGNTVSDNVNPASSNGGVQLQNNQSGNITVRNNTISGNSGSSHTGIRIQNNGDGAILFENNTIANNDNPTAFDGGASLGSGGIGDIQVANNIVFGNSAGGNGGGIIILANAETINVVNNTVFENSVNEAGGSGGGIFIGGGSNTLDINLFNNILFANTAVDADSGGDLLVNFDPASAVQLFNNDFGEACFGAVAPFNCDPATVAGLTQGNNIDADPLFVDAAAANFQLSANSPAINAGDLNAPGLPALDFAGNPRVVNGQVDMGAFEAQPALSVDPASLDFGSVDLGEEQRLALTLSNTGNVALTVSGFQLSDSANYSVDPNGGANPCGSLPFTIEVGESCTIEVVFSPSDEGALDAILTIDSDNPQDISVALTGIGVDNGGGGDLRGGGCSLGAAPIGRGLLSALLIPLSAAALFFRRRR